MITRIVRNKPLAIAVLIFISTALVFHDFLIPPRRGSIEHIPSWMRDVVEVDYSKDDPRLFVSQVGWLVKSLQRHAALGERLDSEVSNIEAALGVLSDHRAAITGKLSRLDAMIKEKRLPDLAMKRHDAAKLGIFSDLEVLEKTLPKLLELAESYNNLQGDDFWLRGLLRNHYRNRILNQGNKLIEAVTHFDRARIDNQYESGNLPTQIPRYSLATNQTTELSLAHPGDGVRLASVLTDVLLGEKALAASPPVEDDLAATPETARTGGIRNLVEQLQNNPVRIYEYVRNRVEFTPSTGSIQGNEGALLSGYGNDVDQASLLISMLREAGIPSRYVSGVIRVPADKVGSWIGSLDPQSSVNVLRDNGIQAELKDVGNGRFIEFEHTWVRAFVPYSTHRGADAGEPGSDWIDLDPSYKLHEYGVHIDVATSLGVDANSFIVSIKDASSIDEANSYATNVPEDFIVEKIDGWGSRVERFAGANGRSPEDLYQKKEIIEQSLQALPSSLPYDVIGEPVESSSLGQDIKHFVTIQIVNPDDSIELSYQADIMTLGRQIASVSYVPAGVEDELILNQFAGEDEVPAYLINVLPRLSIDGEVVAAGQNPVQMASDQAISITFDGPGLESSSAVRPILAGSYVAVVFDAQGVSVENLHARLGELRLLEKELSGSPAIDDLDAVLGKTLQAVGLAYFQELDRMLQIASSSLQVKATRHPSALTIGYELDRDLTFGVPTAARANRFALSIDRNAIVPVSINGDRVDEKQFMTIAGLTSAAFEHNVLTQTLGASAASSLNLLLAANKNGVPVHTLTPDNFEDAMLQMTALPPEVRIKAANAASSGMIVTAPAAEIEYAGYKGASYIVHDPQTGGSGYFMEGGLAGGIRPAAFLTVTDLITPGDSSKYLEILEPVIGWMTLAQEVTTSAAWSYSPAISAIDDWFRDKEELDKVTYIASGIAISGVIDVLSNRANIVQFSASPAVISPGGGGKLDTARITGGISRESDWTVTITDDSDAPIKEFSGRGRLIDLEWDGTDESMAVADDGVYTVTANAVAAGKTIAALPASARIEIDATPPTAIISSPVGGQTVDRVFAVAGTAKDEHFMGYSLDISCNGDPWQNLDARLSPADNATLALVDSSLYPAGPCRIKLTATDSVGLISGDSVTVQNEDQGQAAPVVAITAPQNGQEVSGEIQVTADANDDWDVAKLEFLVNGRVVETVTGQGNGQYSLDLDTQRYDNGTLTIAARAYDERGRKGQDSISVIADNRLYAFSVTPKVVSPNGDGVSDTLTVSGKITAHSNWTITLETASGNTVLKTFSGVGTEALLEWDGKLDTGEAAPNGEYVASLSTGSYVASEGFFIEIVNQPPMLAIHSPGDGDSITAPADVVATVNDLDLVSWKLEYQALDEVGAYDPDAFIELASGGDEPVAERAVAALDPTNMKNDFYVLRLSAIDAEGRESELLSEFIVTGQLKIGLFTISFEDLTVPLGGLSITVGRTYSSIERDEAGDFGHGWKMFLRDIDLKEDAARNVTVNLPDGRRVTFYYKLTQQNPVTLRAAWEAPPGVFDTLEMSEDNRVLYDNLNGQILGFFHDYSTYGTPYQESVVPGYILTTRDGTKYNIVKEVTDRDPITDAPIAWESPALTGVEDLNGNRLVFDGGGVHYGCDMSTCDEWGRNCSDCIEEVTFTRDLAHGGRVTALTDPAGNQVTYRYDASGDLVSTTLQDGAVTRFAYAAHYLTDIVAPTGVRATRNEYDESGRLIAVVDPDGERVEFDHRPGARQEVIKDRLGNVTVYEYDSAGNVVSETNALGHRTEYEYDGDGNKTGETDALGAATSWTYDSKGNMLTKTDAMDNVWTYAYNSRGQLLTATDPLDHVSSSEYDSRGNLTRSVDKLGSETLYEYDSSGNMVLTTNALGDTTSYVYDDKGNRVSTSMTVTDYLGNPATVVTSTAYDAMGNAVSSIDRRGYATTSEYDKKGRLISTTDPLGRTTAYKYNAAGLQTSVIDSNGAETLTVYDDQGRAIEQWSPDGTHTETVYDIEGRVVMSVDKTGQASRTFYDALGRAVKSVRANGAETSSAYDALGRVVQSKDPRGGVSQREYDVLGRTKKVIDALGNETSYEYDELGRQVAMIDANDNRWESEYDAAGRKTATVYPDGTRSSVEYDELGRKVAEVDQAGVRTEFLYDEMGSLIGVDDAEGGETRYAYDAGGNLLSIVDPNGHVTSFTYDELGRKTSRTLPEGMAETWEYRDCCMASSHTDFNGRTVNYEFDEMKRETLRTYPDGKAIGRQYNGRGQLVRVIYTGYEFGAGEPYRDRVFTYDDVTGQLLRDDKEDGQYIAYKYDIAGGLVETTYSGGHVVTYAHDALGRLATVTDDHGITEYTYDAAGNRKSMAYPNGTLATYEFDELNRLTYLENSGPEGVISSYSYTLGPSGNRVSIKENNGDVNDYEYDDLYRLTRESRTGNNAYWIEYDYDAFGNRLDMNVGGVLTTYAYDDNDRLLTESETSGITSYTWDDNGNMTGKASTGETWQYEWDLENKMTVAEKDGQEESSYSYDFRGERIHKVTDSESVVYLIDNNNRTGYSQALREVSDGVELVNYTFGDDLISQGRQEVSYLHYDGLGSTRALTSASREVTDTINFLAFGSMLDRTGSTIITHLFTGEAYDFNLGYYYFRARLYDAFSGRFISQDDYLGKEYDPKSIHKYLYTSNNPLQFVDYSGYSLIEIMTNIAVRVYLAAMAVSNYLLMMGESLATLTLFFMLRDVQSLYSGVDPDTGEQLATWEWMLIFIGVVTDPIIPGDSGTIRRVSMKGYTLLRGNTKFGWFHIVGRHIKGLWRKGKFKTDIFPASWTEHEVEEWVIHAVDHGTEVPGIANKGNKCIEYVLDVPKDGVEKIYVIVSDESKVIITSWPDGPGVISLPPE